jgi:hypothetical protein
MIKDKKHNPLSRKMDFARVETRHFTVVFSPTFNHQAGLLDNYSWSLFISFG